LRKKLFEPLIRVTCKTTNQTSTRGGSGGQLSRRTKRLLNKNSSPHQSVLKAKWRLLAHDGGMATHHILMIEDDRDIADLLTQDLEDTGYKVSLADSVMHGLLMVRELQPDLILLDLGLPDGDGRQVLTRVRKGSDLPVIVLTARDDIDEKVELLNLGADDYLVKPFHTEELLARIAVQLRQDGGDMMTLGDLELHASKRLALYKGKELRLSPKEFELLTLLMRQPGRVYSRLELIKEVWSGNLPDGSNVVDVHFANMRSKFRDAEMYGLLRTVRGVGYALRA
jgi:two-component system, OmpR family, copper resistance phosphate regulon response regulator CusR